MSLHDYLRLGRRWLPIALVAAVIAAIVAYELTRSLVPRSYTASVVMQVQLGSPGSTDPVSNSAFAQTESAVANQQPMVVGAVSRASKADPTEAEAPKNVQVTCVATGLTALVTCSVTAHHARYAALVANSLAAVFIQRQQQLAQGQWKRLLKTVTSQESLLQVQISETNAQIRKLEASSRPSFDSLALLNSKVDSYQNNYNNLQQTEMTLRSSLAQQTGAAQVVAPAILPTAPSSPHPTLNALIAAFLVFALVFGFAVVNYQFNDGIEGEEDIKEMTGLPVLGTIPMVSQLKNKSPGLQSLVMVDQPTSLASEAFRLTQAGITYSQGSVPPRVLLVASTAEGEGKSTVAANLAAAFAEAGKSVVLVDLDMRRPAIGAFFDVPRGGLTSLLLNAAADPESVLVQTAVPGLRVLPCGTIPANPAELLRWQQMAQVIERLRSVADVVIIDSPPLLSFADAAAIAPLCDSVLLVARPDHLKRRSVARAVDILRSVRANVVGTVINAAPTAETQDYDRRYQRNPAQART